MKICVLTASLGTLDKIVNHVEQQVPDGTMVDYVQITDENFPPRRMTMSPRLQARIPKMFGWQMYPDYDAYIWLDASFTFHNENSVSTVWEKLQQSDVVTYLHPHRDTIKQEADFLVEKQESKYIHSRYGGELLNEQLQAIPETYKDDVLYASMLVGYWNTEKVQNMMKDWWYHTSRYHAIDQLSFPYVLRKHKCTVQVMGDDPYKSKFIRYVRNRNV